MVREFQSVIGSEARAQFLELVGGLPDAVVACVGGGSNAIGIFDAFVDDLRACGSSASKLAAKKSSRGRHAARFAGGSAGVLQGTRTFVLQDEHGNIELTHSISAGLDYAAVGPEHAWLRSLGRAEYAYVSDDEALEAFQSLARLEGILPALESSHAIAYAGKIAKALGPSTTMLRQPVGPRRQGREQRRKGAGRPVTRIAETFARLRAERRAGSRRRTRRPAIRIFRAPPAFSKRSSAAARTFSRLACRSPIRSLTVR